MSTTHPEDLAHVPAYANQLFTRALSQRDMRLGELASSILAVSGLGGELLYGNDLADILTEGQGCIRRGAREVYDMVGGLVTGAARQAYVNASSGNSLETGHDVISRISDPSERHAMAEAFNHLVLTNALATPNLYLATTTITRFSTMDARPAIRAALDLNVFMSAIQAGSLSTAQDTVQSFAYSIARTGMYQAVAKKWLPVEQESLEHEQSRLADIQRRLDELDAMKFFQRMFRSYSRRELRGERTRATNVVAHYDCQVRELQHHLGA